jgi:pimeloyl-ACP methyl ester carboxylesterase
MRRKDYFEEYLATGPVKQYLLHYKARPEDPVLLIVHGGPGFTISNLGHVLKKQWGDAFTLVFWDQRGSGKTLTASGEPDGADGYTITFEDIMDDLHAVVEHLKQFYGVEKIALMGQSFGTLLGSHYVHRHPENLSVYIGMVQVVCWDKNWKESYEHLVELVRAAGDAKSESIIASWGGVPECVSAPNLTKEILERLAAFNKLRAKYGMVMSLSPKLLWDFIRSPVFKFSDFSFLKKASAMRNRHLVEWMLACDLERECPLAYPVPVAYILGDLDYQAVYTIAEAYFDKIQAPKKYLNVVKNACHNVMYDQPKLFAEAIWEIREMIQS